MGLFDFFNKGSGLFDVVLGSLGMYSQKRANERNIGLQKDLARHGIKYRVQDAKEAGIHPLYALGAPAFSSTPSQVGIDTSQVSDGLKQLAKRDVKTGTEKLKEMAEIKLLDAQARSLDRMGQGNTGNTEIDPVVGAPTQDKVVTTPDPSGSTEKGLEPFDRWTIKDGYAFKVPTQSMQELVTEMNPVALRYYRDWAFGGVNTLNYKSRWHTEDASKFRQFIIKYIRPPKTPEMLKENMEWRYRPGYGFKKYKVYGYSYFYEDGTANIPNDGNIKGLRGKIPGKPKKKSYILGPGKVSKFY